MIYGYIKIPTVNSRWLQPKDFYIPGGYLQFEGRPLWYILRVHGVSPHLPLGKNSKGGSLDGETLAN